MLRSPVTRVTTIVLLILSVVSWAVYPPGRVFMPYRIDFDVYRTGGQVFLEGGPLYGAMPPLSQGALLPFTYPPIAAVLFSAFAMIPLWVGSLLLTLGSMACLWWIARLIERRTPLAALLPKGVTQRDITLVMMIAFTVGLWFGPVRETFLFGQVNIILTALVLADVSSERRRWWSGALVGLAIAIKLTPAVFLLFFFLRGDWRSMLRTVASFLLFTGIGHLAMPAESHRYWTEVVFNTGRIGGAAYASNQSINGALARFGTDGTTPTLLWFGVSLVAGLIVAWSAWRLLRSGQRVVAGVVVGFAALFCSPVSWSHHWIWAWPLITLMVLWALNGSGRVWIWMGGLGVVIFLATPYWWWPRRKLAELEWTWYQHLTGDAVLLWSLVAVILLGARAEQIPRTQPV
ncbi:glycosyltransferase 87 family protein [Tessaracoccus caeni]|uniref:glycosyltransferase 87 family protein n=1 Tax=Tessaracoccus caeni TaxID=3031239 RepID=UPI0023DA29E3|nr:glycosyltransferase 87 family protein [Tessaracoccus caeni]MDF1486939.1 glycosyltransferase 87 family protein [Tessaracoccus caeni]